MCGIENYTTGGYDGMMSSIPMNTLSYQKGLGYESVEQVSR
jgi:hypothetical protein